MAIIIEEEKKRSSGLTRLIGWIVILVIITVAIYYVFFAAPELVIITPGDTISTIAPVAQQSISAASVIQNPEFKILIPSTVPAVSTSTGPSGGRPNPFVSP